MNRLLKYLIVVAALVCAAGQSWAAIVVTNIGTATGSSGATLSLTGVTVPAGALIFVAVIEYNGVNTSGSVADSVDAGNFSAGTPIGSDNNPNAYGYGNYYFLANSAGLSSGSITYTKGASGGYVAMTAFYATGVAKTSALDAAVTATVYGSGSSYSLTSGTPAVHSELFVAFQMGSAAFTQDSANNWIAPPTTVIYAAVPNRIDGGSQVNPGTSPIVFSPGAGGLNPYYVTWIIGFKPIPSSPSFFKPFP
jgi:hypothetical protein